MNIQSMFTLAIGLCSHWAKRRSLIFGCGLMVLDAVLMWQLSTQFAVVASKRISSSGNSTFFNTITVTTTLDDNTPNGNCTLREAILAANTNAAVDGCAAGAAGADVIAFNLGAGTPTINVSGSALPTITETLTIDGATGGATRVELNGAGAGAEVNGLLIQNANNCTIKNLIINRFNGTPGVFPDLRPEGNGIKVIRSSATIIENCFIGTNATGDAALPNGSNGIYGFEVDHSDIRNNLLSGNGQHGIHFHAGQSGCQLNNVRGNKLGTNQAGTAALPNAGNGLEIGSCVNNTVGGLTATDRNLVSGNLGNGMVLSHGTTVQGNYVGVDITGTSIIGNGRYGMDNIGLNCVFGGTVPEARNIISGNGSGGIAFLSLSIHGPTNSQVLGNYIGTDVTGTLNFGNGGIGIHIRESNFITIGGTTPAERNVISGNTDVGVLLQAATDCQVLGNYIGPNVNGTAVFSSQYGVKIDSGNVNHLISGNVISGHSLYGVVLQYPINVRLFGNIIGASPTLTPMPNYIGVAASSTPGNSTYSSQIGGTGAGEGNVIAFNTEDGVQVAEGEKHRISGNSIYSNGDLGIDLNRDGVTANDAGDGDSGPNNLQNYPVITQATTSNIQGTLNSTANTAFALQFFHNPACDSAGNGEGQTYLGQTTVTTDGSGNAAFNFAVSVPSGGVVTATATDPQGNTSEFSGCRAVLGQEIAGTVFEDVNYGGGAGRSLTASAGAPVANARVELYDAAGSFVTFATTNASGQYSFGNLTPGNYSVRVVNGSIVSTRPGGAACGNCVPVQTFRTNASGGTALPVTDHVGGAVPSKVDAGNGSTALAALTTVTTVAQSVAAVAVNGSVSGVDFGFNFDTVVNVNANGQGSCRQYSVNAFELGGEAVLAQAGNRMDIRILPSHPAITSEPLPAGKETSIFMISDGQAHPGLNAGYANLLTSGVALITTVTGYGPSIRGPHTTLDGTTQTANVGNTNTAVLGTGGFVGGNNNIPLTRLDGPEIQMRSLDPAPVHQYAAAIVGHNITIRGIAGQGAGGYFDILIQDYSAMDPLIEQNVLGASALNFNRLPGDYALENLHMGETNTNVIVRHNLMKGAGDMNLHLIRNAFALVEGNEFNTTTGHPRSPEIGTGGPNVRNEGTNNITVINNLFTGGQQGGMQIVANVGFGGGSYNTIRDNTITDCQVGGVIVTSNGGTDLNRVCFGNTITRNSFYNNAGLAIDLDPLPLVFLYAPPEGVTPNDGTFSNSLPNGGVDYPVFTSATYNSGVLSVQGFVGVAPSQGGFGNSNVEVFIADNTPADQNGEVVSGDGQSIAHGEGRTYLGSCVTDTSANFSCSITVPVGVIITLGTTRLTATATTLNYNNNTSEFGPNFLIACPPITLASATLSAGTMGAFYTQTLSASGGGAPYTFALGAGTSLPAGLNLSAAGVLSGMPAQMGSFSFTVVATAANGCTGTAAYTLTIGCPVVTLNPATLPGGTVGVAYSQLLTGAAGTPPYSFSLGANPLPTGLNLSSGGLLSGTPLQFGDFPITINVQDQGGCPGSQSYLLRINRPPVARCKNVTVEAGAACMAQAVIDDGSSDPDGDTLTLTQSPAGPYAVGTHTVTLTADDGRGGVSQCTATVTVTAPQPVPTLAGPVSGSIYQTGTPVNFTGTFTDLAGTTHTASWKFESATPPAITAAGTVIEPTGTTPGQVSVTQTFTTPGVYLVTLTVTNNCGGTASTSVIGADQFSALVVIYDPGAGFVTGGGWINSPAGAYVADPTLTGKANFGFVSKYQNGASVPSGNTEFQFKAGNLNFHSTAYEWLVIAGARAQYKGSGRINNSGDYRFLLTAIDGRQPGGGGEDKFRIRIWNNAGGGLVYDNQMNAPDSADPTTLLGGGSIVIHK